jgi:hypothetical protein
VGKFEGVHGLPPSPLLPVLDPQMVEILCAWSSVAHRVVRLGSRAAPRGYMDMAITFAMTVPQHIEAIAGAGSQGRHA